MGYCYTAYLLSQHCVFWILILIFEDREQFISWEATCTVSECCQFFHKQTKKKNTESLQQTEDSVFVSFLKSDLHHWDIIHFKYPLQLILCVIRKLIPKKTTYLGRDWKENSTETKLSRHTGHSLPVVLNCIGNHSAKSVCLINSNPWFENRQDKSSLVILKLCNYVNHSLQGWNWMIHFMLNG